MLYVAKRLKDSLPDNHLLFTCDFEESVLSSFITKMHLFFSRLIGHGDCDYARHPVPRTSLFIGKCQLLKPEIFHSDIQPTARQPCSYKICTASPVAKLVMEGSPMPRYFYEHKKSAASSWSSFPSSLHVCPQSHNSIPSIACGLYIPELVLVVARQESWAFLGIYFSHSSQ
jgi:hypothetical protein